MGKHFENNKIISPFGKGGAKQKHKNKQITNQQTNKQITNKQKQKQTKTKTNTKTNKNKNNTQIKIF